MQPKQWSSKALTLFIIALFGTLGGCDLIDSDDFDDGDDSGIVYGDDDDYSPGDEQVFYVSVDGDDDDDGLSENSAFRTLARAAEVFRAGDTLSIMPGVHVGRLMFENVGTTQAATTIRGTAAGAVLDGENRLDVGIWCEQCPNIVIEDLEIRNYTDIGVAVLKSTTVTVRRLEIHDNGHAATMDWVEGYGLLVEESTGVLIEDNEAYANGPSPQRPDRLMGTGIDTFGNRDVIIRNNNSHDNTGGGYLIEDSVDVLFENNIATGNDLDATAEEWWDGALWVDGGHDVTVRNNTFIGNLGPALQFSNEDNQDVYGYVVEDNTITDNYYGMYIWNFGTEDLPPDDILRVEGNVITGSSVQDYLIEALPCPPDDPCD